MTTMAKSSQDAFDFLFPAPLATGPTPAATPVLGFAGEGESFGGVGVAERPSSEEAWNESSLAAYARRMAALNTAKTFLSNITTLQTDVGRGRTGVKRLQERLRKAANNSGSDVKDSFRLLLANWPQMKSTTSTTLWDEDILEWYISFIRADFQNDIGPQLEKLWTNGSQNLKGENQAVLNRTLLTLFEQTCDLLSFAQQAYSIAVVEYMMSIFAPSRPNSRSNAADSALPKANQAAKLGRKCSRAIHAMFVENLPMEKIHQALYTIILDACSRIFRLGSQVDKGESNKASPRHRNKSEPAVQLIMQLFENIREVGLGGPAAVRTFALAMEELVTKFIASPWMAVDWERRASVIDDLSEWIERFFAPFVKSAIECLTGEESTQMNEETNQWVNMAITRLGKSRIENLFEYICMWPRSEGAILDLKAYAKTPEARNYLTQMFQQDVERHLLHAGITSKHILDIYMLVIQVFARIDSRGVLLDNVSRPIRKYLRTRADVSKIIISSMLADPKDTRIQRSADISKAIAEEMLRPIKANDLQRQDRELDYDNMEYMPQPTDASSDFKRNESNDAISYLLSLYDKEQFLSVLKNILGEHLLKSIEDVDLQKETHLLELFKSRFGADKLQACDVMLRDISNSRRLNDSIHIIPKSQTAISSSEQQDVGLNTQVLSSWYWPELREDTFHLPEPVQSLQAEFEKGFENQHNMMRLKWLPALGRATVELHFEDRVVNESVPPWVASVAYAFNETEDGSSSSKNIEQLSEELEMDEALVRNAVQFWVSKRVLAEDSSGSYFVLETLENQQCQAVPILQEEVSAVTSTQDTFEKQSEVYRVFVFNMLMNGGAMPLPVILQMLKIVIPEGFPFGDAELKSLLDSMVDEGKLLSSGGLYSVNKV